MNELPYFYFIVMAEPKAWPYYAEIPYAAWPDESMSYNSDGNCRAAYDQNWSYLDVMNWETHENIVVCNTMMFASERVNQTRALIESFLNEGEDLLSLSHIARHLLYLMDNIPTEYRTPGHVAISSFRCKNPAVTASIAALFLRRLHSDTIWDAQGGRIINTSSLFTDYLQDFPNEASQRISDEVQRWFDAARQKHQTQPDTPIDWWKTLAQVRQYVQGQQVAG